MGVFICDTQPIEESSKPGQLFKDEMSKLIDYGDIWKLTLPSSESQNLIHMLDKKRISPMYLMPTYERVAERVLKSVDRN